jgi:hypothetical protein
LSDLGVDIGQFLWTADALLWTVDNFPDIGADFFGIPIAHTGLGE